MQLVDLPFCSCSLSLVFQLAYIFDHFIELWLMILFLCCPNWPISVDLWPRPMLPCTCVQKAAEAVLSILLVVCRLWVWAGECRMEFCCATCCCQPKWPKGMLSCRGATWLSFVYVTIPQSTMYIPSPVAFVVLCTSSALDEWGPATWGTPAISYLCQRFIRWAYGNCTPTV